MEGTNVPKQPTIPAMPNKREVGGKGMSKKYIIEIEDAPYMAEEGNTSIALYKAVGFNSLLFDKNGLDKLAPYIADEAYEEGYTLAESKYREVRDQVEREAYQRGLDDSWEAARKITYLVSNGGLEIEALHSLFYTSSYLEIFATYTAAEAVEKIREYEAQKAKDDEICNGDEVYFTLFSQNFKAIAIQHDLEGRWQVLGDRGGLIEVDESALTKTGRHVDLTELFGGEDE